MNGKKFKNITIFTCKNILSFGRVKMSSSNFFRHFCIRNPLSNLIKYFTKFKRGRYDPKSFTLNFIRSCVASLGGEENQIMWILQLNLALMGY